MNNKYKHLNLGCGEDYREDYINIDIANKFKTDLIFNLECVKQLPFPRNSVELIRAVHVLEHINNFVGLLKEIYRVLIPEGVFYVKVPDATCRAAYADPTHVRYFVPETFHYISGGISCTDSHDIAGLFDLKYLNVIKHDSGELDKGTKGRWFTEIECELIKRPGK